MDFTKRPPSPVPPGARPPKRTVLDYSHRSSIRQPRSRPRIKRKEQDSEPSSRAKAAEPSFWPSTAPPEDVKPDLRRLNSVTLEPEPEPGLIVVKQESEEEEEQSWLFSSTFSQGLGRPIARVPVRPHSADQPRRSPATVPDRLFSLEEEVDELDEEEEEQTQVEDDLFAGLDIPRADDDFWSEFRATTAEDEDQRMHSVQPEDGLVSQADFVSFRGPSMSPRPDDTLDGLWGEGDEEMDELQELEPSARGGERGASGCNVGGTTSASPVKADRPTTSTAGSATPGPRASRLILCSATSWATADADQPSRSQVPRQGPARRRPTCGPSSSNCAPN